ncbi:MAG: class I SAM-dependent methyltransferase [Pseudomonadota bacterium]|nr:class I SAM-dependent methyltransferase [Pseudomonadota bacterium]
MPSPPGASGRDLDAAAVDATLRRTARQDEAPWLHREVARRLAEHLDPIRLQPGRVFDWWAGWGDGATALQARYPNATIVAIEADAGWAARPMARPKRRWWPSPRGQASARLVAGADDAALGSAQLLWANMVLHAVVDPPALFKRWHALLEVDGVLVFSCLGPATLKELRALYAGLQWPPPTPGFIDMHDLGDMMVAAGFAAPVLDQETLVLTWADAEAVLRDLRQLGGNASPQRFRGLRTPRWRQRLLAALDAQSGADGRISLSFEIAYGHGFKVAPRVAAGEPVAVSLEAMRALVRRPGR